MASENETVADIAREMREMPKDWIVDANANFVFVRYANRLEDAYRREVETVIKDRDEMYKSEQETVAKTMAWFEEYQNLKRKVNELRECLIGLEGAAK